MAVMMAAWTSPGARAEASTGEENFSTICGACHTIGGGVRVGPDLKDVSQRRTGEWLLRYITSSQTMIRSGDPTAVALFAEFNNVVMPDAPYSADEIKEILAFINSGKATVEVPLRVATPEDIRKGQEMFQGTLRFANGGPACNSCHHVRNDAVIGGGVLAKDLTSVFSRMGAPGVQAILGKPPFPVMEQAYKAMALTEDEVVALVGFLQDADQRQAFQQPRDYGFKLFASGLTGLVALTALYALIWRRRKTRPINHEIFARQVRTQGENT